MCGRFRESSGIFGARLDGAEKKRLLRGKGVICPSGRFHKRASGVVEGWGWGLEIPKETAVFEWEGYSQ